MAFTKDYRQYKRWDDFHFYFSGKADGWKEQSLNFVTEGYPYKINEMRLHFSTAFASVEDFIMRVSSIHGSMYNTIWISEPLNGVRDLVVFFSQALNFFSDDQIIFAASMKSNINGYGLEVLGWAAIG